MPNIWFGSVSHDKGFFRGANMVFTVIRKLLAVDQA